MMIMAEAFVNHHIPAFSQHSSFRHRGSFGMVLGDEAPSDYDSSDLVSAKGVTVDTNDDDAPIRDALKRELLLLASVTNRGEYATKEERDIIIDLVTQLEALNPTLDPSSNCEGDWDLALSSTQFFRSSPFFQSIRVALGNDNKRIADNAFDLHDRATTVSRIGRVRQRITFDTLVSEVDLEVGIAPGIPIRIKGTVVTTANLKVISPEGWGLRVTNTLVKGSNVPFFNQFLDERHIELPMGNIFSTLLQGEVPEVKMKVRTCRRLLALSSSVIILNFTAFCCSFLFSCETDVLC
jgi:PAP_fibrillin